MKRTILFSGILLAGLMIIASPDSRANENPFKEKLDKTQIQDTTNVRKNDRLKRNMPSENDTSKWNKDHKKWQDSTDVHKDHMMKDTTKSMYKKKK